MLSKSPRYYYDADAIKEPAVNGDGNKPRGSKGQAKPNSGRRGEETEPCAPVTMRNKRDVWHVNTAPCREAHFATFPPKLVQPMVLAGSRPGGVVLDPFCGSGTTGVVAAQEGRRFVGIDLSEEYCEIAKRRLIHDGGVTHASAV
jgi:DNA modification methylase